MALEGEKAMEMGSDTVTCTVYQAEPSRMPVFAKECTAEQQNGVVILANGYFSAEIPADSGVITSVKNKIINEAYEFQNDQFGFVIVPEGGKKLEWLATLDKKRPFDVKIEKGAEVSKVFLTAHEDRLTITVVYTIRKDQFWLERFTKIEGKEPQVRFDKLIYGKLEVAGAKARILELGKFDRPRLVAVSNNGGIFGGVGWWFYSVDESGVYQNADMAYTHEGIFESEPWYVGVYTAEAGEPFPGWLWYKNFLHCRKAAYDKQKCWSYWNAGWGQWDIDIDDPAAGPFLELMHRLGVRSIGFGSGSDGKGIPAYVELARSSELVKKHLALLHKCHMGIGALEHGGMEEKWADPNFMKSKFKLLADYVTAGYNVFHFDFFSTLDTFTAHRNVAAYFRAARNKLVYTECHLGMATYGPQFQREVLINHPRDIKGFDISLFSSDWATFLGFRHSRAEWQRKYQYLMPEYGLYYYLTHYANWGHPRLYQDPEPQQFLYGPHAYCGIAYNFHDTIGFRDVLAAASAFSPYYVFGHLDLKMPERDLAFGRDYIKWVKENVDVLRPARVCFEDKDACVVSKVKESKGAIFIINFGPGRKCFKLKLQLGQKNGEGLTMREIYPERKKPYPAKNGDEVEISVRGESTVILDVNGGFKTLPPENASGFPIDIQDWKKDMKGCEGKFFLPDISKALAKAGDANLPKELLSIEQIGGTPKELADANSKFAEKLGRGKLPERFLRVYAFKEDKTVATWKIAPWAFPDKVWLIYRPSKPVLLAGTFPVLTVNGKNVEMFPRVDYRPKDVKDWTCPLFFTDVTEACKYGKENAVVFSGLSEDRPANCYIVSAADRR